MALGPLSQTGGAMGKSNQLKVWWMEGIGGRHKRKSLIQMVEGSGFTSSAAAEPSNQTGNRLEGGWR